MVERSHTQSCRPLAPKIHFVSGSALPPDESPTFLETWWAMQEVLETGSTKTLRVAS